MADATITANERANAFQSLPVLKQLFIGKNTGWRSNTDFVFSDSTAAAATAAVYDAVGKRYYLLTKGASARLHIYNDAGDETHTLTPPTASSGLFGDNGFNMFSINTMDNTIMWGSDVPIADDAVVATITNNIITTCTGAEDAEFIADFVWDNDRKLFYGIIDQDLTLGNTVISEFDAANKMTRLDAWAFNPQPAVGTIKKIAIADERIFILSNGASNGGGGDVYLYIFARGVWNNYLTSFSTITGGNKLIPPKIYGTDWYNGSSSILNARTLHIRIFDNHLVICNYESNTKFGFYVIDLKEMGLTQGSYVKHYITPNEVAAMKIPQYGGQANTDNIGGVSLGMIPVFYDAEEHVLSYAYSDSSTWGIYHYNFLTETGLAEQYSATAGSSIDTIQVIDKNRMLVLLNKGTTNPLIYLKNKYAYTDITDRTVDFGRGTQRAEQPPNDTQFVISNMSITLRNENGYFDQDWSASFWRTNNIQTPIGAPIKFKLSRKLPDGTWSSKKDIYHYKILDYPEIDSAEKKATFQIVPLSYDMNALPAKQCGDLIGEYLTITAGAFTATETPIIDGTVSVWLTDGSTTTRAIIVRGQTAALSRADHVYYNSSTGVFTLENDTVGYTNAFIVYRAAFLNKSPDFLASRLLDIATYYDRSILPSAILAADGNELAISPQLKLPDGLVGNKYVIPGPEGYNYFWVCVPVTPATGTYGTAIMKYYTKGNSISLATTATIPGRIASGASNQLVGSSEILAGIYLNDAGAQRAWRYSVGSDAVAVNANLTQFNYLYARRTSPLGQGQYDTLGKNYIASFGGADYLLTPYFGAASGAGSVHIVGIPIAFAGFAAATNANVYNLSQAAAVEEASTAHIAMFCGGYPPGGRASGVIHYLVTDEDAVGNPMTIMNHCTCRINTTATGTNNMNLVHTWDFANKISVLEADGPGYAFFFTVADQSNVGFICYFNTQNTTYHDNPPGEIIATYNATSKIPRSILYDGSGYYYMVMGNGISPESGNGRIVRIPEKDATQVTATDFASYFAMDSADTGTAANGIKIGSKFYFVSHPGSVLYSIGINTNQYITEFNPAEQTIFQALSSLAKDSHCTFFTNLLGRFIWKPKFGSGLDPNAGNKFIVVEDFNDNGSTGAVFGNLPKITTTAEIANVLIGTYNSGNSVEIWPPDGHANESARLFGRQTLKIDFDSYTSAQDGALVRALLRAYHAALTWPKIRIRFDAPFMEWIGLKDSITFKFLSLFRAASVNNAPRMAATVDGIDVDFTNLKSTLEIVLEKPQAYPTADMASIGGAYTIITSAETIGAAVQIAVTNSSRFNAGDSVIIYTDWYSFVTSITSVDSGTTMTVGEILATIGVNDKAIIAVISRAPRWDINFRWDMHHWDAVG